MATLSQTTFQFPSPGWDDPTQIEEARSRRSGLLLSPGRDESLSLGGPGVHTRNGDSIELVFTPLEKQGTLRFGFSGGMESAVVTLQLTTGKAELRTSEWNRPQPVARGKVALEHGKRNRLVLHKTECSGTLVKSCNVAATLNGKPLLEGCNLDLLPELGVTVGATYTRVNLHRFVHKGSPSGIPEYLRVGGWQTINAPDIDANLSSLCRGIDQAADRGIQLLVTPETSLSGLFPRHAVTADPVPIKAAEAKLRRRLRKVSNAPYTVVGLPVWEKGPGAHSTRLNVSRLYDPDGHIVDTCCKIHSCEANFWHGFRLHEFDIHGVPCCMHICHDGRYPETWTLPVMFGSRLILHPSNGGAVRGSVDAFERTSGGSTSTSHAFYVRINGGGGSCIAGPQKFDNLLDVSTECRRDNRAFPMVGKPVECLLEANIRIHDAFGYWPVRSFRASEEIAAAQLALYRALGGKRTPH